MEIPSAEIPRDKEWTRIDTTPPVRGRYNHKNAYGKQEVHNIYAKTREECEEKLAVMIAQVKDDIKAEKKLLKAMKELSPNMFKN